MKILVIDVGGTHVKFLVAGQAERRRIDSGAGFTPQQLVAGVKAQTSDWTFDAVTIGIPSPVLRGAVMAEPCHLGTGWVGYDFAAAFGVPVKIMNDAAMQALGSDEGGRMLFMGLGSGLGTALVDEGRVVSLELAHLPFRDKTFEDYCGRQGLEELGEERWHTVVIEVAQLLRAAVAAEYVVLGGGNARLIRELPAWIHRGANDKAFDGGRRAWDTDRTLAPLHPGTPAPSGISESP